MECGIGFTDDARSIDHDDADACAIEHHAKACFSGEAFRLAPHARKFVTMAEIARDHERKYERCDDAEQARNDDEHAALRKQFDTLRHEGAIRRLERDLQSRERLHRGMRRAGESGKF